MQARRWIGLVALSLLLLGSCGAGRAPEAELQQIVAALQLRPGMQVADVGAGDGEWSEALAQRLGDQGHLYSTEIDEDDLEDIQERLEAAGLTNATTILGGEDATGLEENCCDAILLRLVYHHFKDPPTMIADVRRALRPGGRLVVIEIIPQKSWARLDGVPERDGHGISPEALLDEMSRMASDWTVELREDDWGSEDDHYCVVFR